MKTIPFSHVRELYAHNQPDGHWFNRSTSAFFKTKLPAKAYETDAGVLFVTSETNPSGRKAFSNTSRRRLEVPTTAPGGNASSDEK